MLTLCVVRIQPQSTHKDPGNCKADLLAGVKIEAYASLPLVLRSLESLGGIPVSQHVVPDFLHQLECPGQW